MSAEQNLVLYELEGCPYCLKVRRAMSDLDLSYESRSVSHSRGNRPEVREISGQSGVPVLIDREKGIDGMPESDDIVDYLYEEYGNGQSPPPSGLVGRLLATLF